MISTEDAFRKFRSRLELNTQEQKNASKRQQEIRGWMDQGFDLERDFLTGSYARHTKTKPLKDVDIFCVLGSSERARRQQSTEQILADVRDVLTEHYGQESVRMQRRSVSVDFQIGVDADDNTNYQVVSFDVVPAFSESSYYEIPDRTTGTWVKTDPEIHAEKAIAANKAFDGEWKGLVRMMKYWNTHNSKPIKPSFLIEVMALDVLHPPFGGELAREMQGFFSAVGGRIGEQWNDPAGLGPPVSERMTSADVLTAKVALNKAERAAANAIHLSRIGKEGDSLRAWRDLFGPKFPLS